MNNAIPFYFTRFIGQIEMKYNKKEINVYLKNSNNINKVIDRFLMGNIEFGIK